jgi:hypothetical protein
MTASIIPLLTLIEHQSELIVGCILFADTKPQNIPTWGLTGITLRILGNSQNSYTAPSWFSRLDLSLHPGRHLLETANRNNYGIRFDAFLIVKEPQSFLDLKVLAAINCYNINSTGEGGRGGKKLLTLLADQNIPTHCSDKILPPKQPNWDEQVKSIFYEEFNQVAIDWLPETWGLDNLHLFGRLYPHQRRS